MMKKVINILFGTLFVMLLITWHYKKPFLKDFGDRGFIMVYHVEGRPELKAKVVIITKIKEKLVVEIIKGPGIENVVKLEGEKANRYLTDADLEY